jgi:hypothetical protein
VLMRAKPRHSHIVIAFKNAPQIAQISGANAAAFHGQHHALEAFLCLKIHSSVNALVAGFFSRKAPAEDTAMMHLDKLYHTGALRKETAQSDNLSDAAALRVMGGIRQLVLESPA